MTANIKKSARYQMADLTKALIIYYIVILVIQLANWIIASALNQGRATFMVISSNSSVDTISVFFLFVVGLNAFKENFGMLLQNGFSRRSVMAGRLASFGLLAAVMTVIDRVLTLLFSLLGQATNTYSTLTTFEMTYGTGGFGWQLLGLLFTFLMYLAMLAIGYCISLMFYRLGKLGKVLVGAGVPVLVLIVGPVLDLNLTGGKVYAAIATFFARAFGLTSGQPWYAVLSLLVLSALAGLCGWLLIRRAVVRK